jgi:two-component sensor histidine kinase
LNIDIHTLALVLSLTNLLQIIALFALFRVKRTFGGPGWWTIGNAAWAMGFAFNYLGDLPVLGRIAIVANNALLVSGLAMFYIGILRFMGRRERKGLILACCLLVTLIAVIFTAIDGNPLVRRVNISTALAAFSFLSAWTLFARKIRFVSVSAKLLASAFVVNGGFFGQRALTPLFSPAGDFFNPTLTQTSTYLIALTVCSLWTLGFILLVNQRLAAEARADKEELDLLLKEVHHRVKNNMNTIISLLDLQAATLDDPAAIAALADAGSRVQTMMVLYDKLYQSTNVNEVAVDKYLPALVEQIVENFPNSGSIRTRTHSEEFALDPRQLSCLGMIINELLTNAMKYAFVGKPFGQIGVAAAMKGEMVSISIEDDGVGMPEAIDFAHSTGFGLGLVEMLTRQIGGNLRIERGNGTKIVLEFKKDRG